MALGKERRGLEDRLWKMFAYVARYGMQPLSEMRGLTVTELSRLANELSEIIVDEGSPRRS